MDCRYGPVVGTAFHRPVASLDGSLIVAATPDGQIQIFCLDHDLAEFKLRHSITLPKNAQQFFSRLSIIQLYTGDDDDTMLDWTQKAETSLVLLSDGARILVLRMAVTQQNPNGSQTRQIVADYQVGDQFGKISYANFILGDQHLLLLYEMGVHASFVSLAGPRRDDLLNVKFNSSRGFHVSSNKRSLALLVRSKGQDQITVFGLENDVLGHQTSFNTHTSDAQGLLWSPDQDPVIVVWDAAAHGAKVVFFSAMGHALKQLELSTIPGVSLHIQGVGITSLKWLKTANDTVFAIADGHKRVYARHQHNRTMALNPLTSFVHPEVIDGTKYIVWQETSNAETSFSLQKGAFEAVLDASKGMDIDLLELNSDCSFIATRVMDNTKVVWLWQPEHPEPHTVITFSDAIRQLQWHPTLPNVLLIITNQKRPRVYVWHSETKPPAIGDIPISNTISTKWEGAWLCKDINGRYPFMFTSPKAFQVGFLEPRDGEIYFKSMLSQNLVLDSDHDEDISEDVFTPSKPSRRSKSDMAHDMDEFNYGNGGLTKW